MGATSQLEVLVSYREEMDIGTTAFACIATAGAHRVCLPPIYDLPEPQLYEKLRQPEWHAQEVLEQSGIFFNCFIPMLRADF